MTERCSKRPASQYFRGVGRELSLILISCTILLFACTEKKSQEVAPSNSLQSNMGSLLSDTELPIAVDRFQNGEIDFAWRLQTTFNANGDEVTASIYARSLAIQENDPDAVAVQNIGLSRLEKSKAVCEAMRLNLEVWGRWKDNPIHKYSDGERQYKLKCL